MRRSEQPRPVETQWQPRPVPVEEGVEQRLVRALREAETSHDFHLALSHLERAGVQPQALRSALDAKALDAAALRIEVTIREELLRRLLAVAYGPKLEDLANPQAREHALRVVRGAGSDQLAMMIAAAKPVAGGPIREAAFERWTAGVRQARPEPSTVLVRRLRALRRSRYLKVTAAAAVLAVLGAVFLGGVLLGRSGDDGGSSVAVAPTEPVPVPLVSEPPGGLIAGGYATIGGADPADVTVVAFVRSSDNKVRPQGPCLHATGTMWFCPNRGRPPGENAGLVAYAVPKNETDNVLRMPVPRGRPAHRGSARQPSG